MRETIQNKLNELVDIEIGEEIPDDIIENGKTYFSFSFTETPIDSDFSNNYTNRVNIIGYVKRLVKSNENTLEIVDTAVDNIIKKLKELNIRCGSDDVSMIDNVKKIRITGNGLYNEINNKLV